VIRATAVGTISCTLVPHVHVKPAARACTLRAFARVTGHLMIIHKLQKINFLALFQTTVAKFNQLANNV